MARPRRRRNQTPSPPPEPHQNGEINGNGTANANGADASLPPAPAPPPPRRHISGPQSALTDYLASHNISARQIRDTADARRRQAAEQARRDGIVPEEDAMDVDDGGVGSSRAAEQTAKSKAEQKKIDKIKASKAFQKRKREADSDDDDDSLARAIFQERMAPPPGQMENCEVCGKRFTVTPYSVAGPNGGLCCAPCGREIAKKQAGDKPKKKAPPKRQTGGIGSRRVQQSRVLDGQVGVKNLSTLCVQTMAKNVDLAESLGDLPEHLIDKIARIVSKRRILEPKTLPLFTASKTQVLLMYDGAKMGETELIHAFMSCPDLRRFKMRSAIQFKDEVMDFMLSRNLPLESFYLAGANLLSEDKWHEFLDSRGPHLKELVIKHTDVHVGDATIAKVRDTCPQIQRLKITNNQKVTSEGVRMAGEIQSLQKLGFDLRQTIQPDALAQAIAPDNTLTTLSFRDVPLADDTVLNAIHTRCRNLNKLRITDAEHMTDQGFVKLFTNWENPAIEYIDLRKCRYMDAVGPRDNPDRIGLCDDGFKAMMAHSGQKLRHLNIQSDRHISSQAFEEVFSKDRVYPELAELEVSFCEEGITDFVLGSIFRSCPKIKKVVVFGCMKLRQAMVPHGCVLVGMVNTEGMQRQGQVTNR